MKVFIDFDDVVLDTGRFYRELKKAFVSSGIPEKVFDRDYLDYPVKGRFGVRKYSAREHLELIGKKGYPTGQAEERLERLMADLGRFVFRDFSRFARFVGRKDLFLISYGDNSFQGEKIAKSGVLRYFREAVVSDRGKSESILKILKKDKKMVGERIFFLDDRAEQVAEVKGRIPTMTTFLVKRKEGRYNDKKNRSCDFEIPSLREAVPIIRKINGQKKQNGEE